MNKKYCLTAAIIPVKVESMNDKTRVENEIIKVKGSCFKNNVKTGMPSADDILKFSQSTFFSQIKYCTNIGLSNPMNIKF